MVGSLCDEIKIFRALPFFHYCFKRNKLSDTGSAQRDVYCA